MRKTFLLIIEYTKGIGFLLLIAPFFILFGAGFLFGPIIADYFPKWIGWWFLLAFSLLMCIAGCQKIIDLIRVQREKNCKDMQMSLTKKPKTDLTGLAEEVRKKREERNKGSSKEMIQDLSLVKKPDLDYDGMDQRLARKEVERNKLTPKK